MADNTSVFDHHSTLFDEQRHFEGNKKVSDICDGSESNLESHETSNWMNHMDNADVDLEEFASFNVIDLLKDTNEQLDHVWEGIGYPKERQTQIFAALVHEAHSIYQIALNDAYELKKTMNAQVDTLLVKVARICKTLGDEDPKDYLEPVDDSMSLREHVHFLTDLTSRLESKKNQRIELLHQRFEYLQYISEALGEDVAPSIQENFADHIISSSFVDEVEREISIMENIKSDRVNTLNGILEGIVDLSNDLDLDHSTDLLQWQETRGESIFGLTKQSIDSMLSKLEVLRKEENMRVEKVQAVYEKIEHLWERLSVPKSHQLEFQNSLEKRCKPRDEFVKSIKPTIESTNMLQIELEKMIVLKKENLISLVDDMRTRIRTVWKSLRYGVEQKKESLALFNVSVLTDQVLEDHESEFARLTHQNESLTDIFTMLDKRDQYKEEVAQVQLLSQDPDRFKRRDSFKILKREERCQQLIKKVLPRLELKLQKAIESWEEENGTLLVNDRRVLDELVPEVSTELALVNEVDTVKPRELLARKTRKAEPSSKCSSRSVSQARTPTGTPSHRPEHRRNITRTRDALMTFERSSKGLNSVNVSSIDEISVHKEDPEIEMLCRNASAADQAGNSQKAIELYSEAISKTENRSTLKKLYYNRAQMHQKVKDFDKALRDSSMGLSLDDFKE